MYIYIYIYMSISILTYMSICICIWHTILHIYIYMQYIHLKASLRWLIVTRIQKLCETLVFVFLFNYQFATKINIYKEYIDIYLYHSYIIYIIYIWYIWYIYVYICIYIYIHTYIYCVIYEMLCIDMDKHMKYLWHNYHTGNM